MSTYGLEGVWSAWKAERLTSEQAVGQILQLLLEIDARLVALERRPLNAPTSTPTPTPKKRKKRKTNVDDALEEIM